MVYKTGIVIYKSNMDKIIKSYSDHNIHRVIGELIRHHSQNKKDIRDVVNGLIDYRDIHNLLDLGCGYGWFLEMCPPGFELIMGVDCHDENESEFLKIAGKKTKQPVFNKLFLPAPIDMPSDFFDLIVSAYSLYFFPGMLPEIKRLLKPGGIFIIITHSKAMLEEGESFFSFDNLRKVIEVFSAENGREILERFFDRVSFVDYPNALIFRENDSDALAQYIDFKKAFIARDVDPEIVKERMLEELRLRKLLSFNKNDRIFLVQK